MPPPLQIPNDYSQSQPQLPLLPLFLLPLLLPLLPLLLLPFGLSGL